MSTIGTDQVRRLLIDRKLFPELPADLDDETELVLDSLGLVWLLHQVESQYGLVAEPSDADVDALTSVRAITDYLNRAGTATR